MADFMREWHIVTCEYPPQIGGVSDYTAFLAKSMRDARERVHVWAPGSEETSSTEPQLHRVLGTFDSASLARADRLLDQYPGPRTLLVQWVPHGYGRRSMNVGFCRWLARRVRLHGDLLQLMVHEPFLEFSGVRQSVAAAVHRWMVSTLLRAAERVWLSIPGWEPRLRAYAPANLRMEWLPIPSSIPRAATQDSVRAVRGKLGSPPLLVGHLGTYSPVICEMLEPIIVELLQSHPELSFLMLGSGGNEVRSAFLTRSPNLSNRLFAADYLPSTELSSHLAACDLLIQPYPDGASSRRSSLMAGISHGVPVLTTSGHLSEPLWTDSGAVAIAPAGDRFALTNSARRLIDSPEERARLGEAGLRLYEERFDWPLVIAALSDASKHEQHADATDCEHPPR
jgi:glycosyltransferase involved in cell wall biosynthesis